MNPFHAMQRLTRTVRTVRKKRLATHHAIERKKRGRVKKRTRTLSVEARKARTKKQQVAALRSELLAAYRTTIANLRKVKNAAASALEKVQAQTVELEKLALRYSELSDKSDHSPPSSNGELMVTTIVDAMADQLTDLEVALVATRDE